MFCAPSRRPLVTTDPSSSPAGVSIALGTRGNLGGVEGWTVWVRGGLRGFHFRGLFQRTNSFFLEYRIYLARRYARRRETGHSFTQKYYLQQQDATRVFPYSRRLTFTAIGEDSLLGSLSFLPAFPNRAGGPQSGGRSYIHRRICDLRRMIVFSRWPACCIEH